MRKINREAHQWLLLFPTNKTEHRSIYALHIYKDTHRHNRIALVICGFRDRIVIFDEPRFWRVLKDGNIFDRNRRVNGGSGGSKAKD